MRINMKSTLLAGAIALSVSSVSAFAQDAGATVQAGT